MVLEEVCDKLIPVNLVFDVKGVSFTLDLTKDFEIEDDLIVDLEKNINNVS